MTRFPAHLFSDPVGRFQPSGIEEMVAYLKEPGMISFAGGMPAPETFPIEPFAECAEIIRTEGTTVLQYDNPQGYAPLREFLAAWTSPRMGKKVSPEEILITAGSMQGAHLFTLALLNPGEYALIEEPTFMGVTGSMNNHGVRFIGIPCDHQGLRVDLLEETVEKGRKEGKIIKCLYTIPNFQNPSGTTLSLERRKKLVELAEKLDIMILEDDPYGYVRFSGEHLPTLYSLDTSGRVLYGGSFSKILAPGVRIGWCTGHPDLIRAMNTFKQGEDVSTSVLSQALVYEYCRRGYLDTYLPGIIGYYRKKCDAMERGLREFLPPKSADFVTPRGGFFFWLTTHSVNSGDLFRKGIAHKVAVVPGAPFYPNGGGEHSCRLCFTFPGEADILEGCRRLGKAVQELLPS